MTAELNALEIERRLTRIDAMVATIATKADLHAMETRLIRWMVGSVFMSATVGATVVSAASRFWS